MVTSRNVTTPVLLAQVVEHDFTLQDHEVPSSNPDCAIPKASAFTEVLFERLAFVLVQLSS